jgi:Arc/MetJ-type ribon-helix-helix transcriptional regulator
MTRKKKVPDNVSATLDYELAVILATHVDQSEEYDSRADFVREAIWEKLRDEHGTSDILDEFINRQEELVQTKKHEATASVRRYEQEIQRLKALKKERDETVEEEADEFFEQLEEAEYEQR